jgi:hypothetical protein
MTRKPKSNQDAHAVIISDVHFALGTVALATAALRQALETAEYLKVPLIIAGDLHDTKGIIRAECMIAILDVLREKKNETRVIVLIGNHDLINEKGKDHALHFLDDLCEVIREPVHDRHLGLYFIPYMTSGDELLGHLAEIPEGSTIIMHQGVRGAFMGEYAVDKSSVEPHHFANYRVISGHYHRAQDIVCDDQKHTSVNDIGIFSYIGTPYTITAAEANDPLKGFRILRADLVTLDYHHLHLRRHVTVECSYKDVMKPIDVRPEDILWLKVSGPASELDKLSKKAIGLKQLGHENFKLDKLYEDEAAEAVEAEDYTDEQLLDKIVDDSGETKEQKAYLKSLWRDILS